MVEQHLEEFLRVYEERFVKVHGPLRPVVERVLRAFLHVVVLTIPRLRRGIFRKRRDLLLDLSQCGAEALSEYMSREVGATHGPGSWSRSPPAATCCNGTFGLHVLATDGAFSMAMSYFLRTAGSKSASIFFNSLITLARSAFQICPSSNRTRET